MLDSPLTNEINTLKAKINTHELTLKKLVPDMFSLREELVESKKSYTDFYDFNASIYFTINSNYIIQTLNFQAALLLRIDRQQGINKLFLNFITTKSQDAFKNSIKTLSEKKINQICSIDIVQKGGGKKQIILESTLLGNDLIRLCLLDITDKNQFVDRVFELEKSLDLINNLFQLTDEASAALDSTLKIIVVNQAFNDFFSDFFSRKMMVGVNLIAALAPRPEVQLKIKNACEAALEGNKSSVIIERHSNNNPDDTYYCYELSITPLFNQHYQKHKLIVQIKNHTDFKLQEMRLHQQQADIALSWRTRAIGEMASALTHEINQPLTAINAYSQSCLFIINKKAREDHIANQLIEPLKHIASQAEHAGEVMNNMKKFMREGIFLAELTDINLLIKDTLSILRYELLDFKITITLNLAEHLPKINGNKISIMQVILNLARNSIEALQSDYQENPELTIKTHLSDDEIIVHVCDNGPGIPEQYKNTILNTYFTTKPQGTGIGLGICKTLIEEHGGTLNCLHLKEKGASFVFTLPILNNASSE